MDSLYALFMRRVSGRFYMQVTAKQERDQAGGMAAFGSVAVRFQFLRLTHLEKAFPSESHDPREALPRVPVMDVPPFVRDNGALLQLGELIERITELDSAP
jgi:hypothetical protein